MLAPRQVVWKFSHTLLVPEMVTRDTIGQLGRRPATHYGGQLMKVTIPAVSGVGKPCPSPQLVVVMSATLGSPVATVGAGCDEHNRASSTTDARDGEMECSKAKYEEVLSPTKVRSSLMTTVCLARTTAMFEAIGCRLEPAAVDSYEKRLPVS
ncbi:hypothetical protein RRG08_055401 [Elysia crispata]|uniref:Uncharacterized protein n=1 Tax=Elysia crispata TaxID=231223 RepID=A0AAE1AQS0_9GAST|nr:hypothetical protein RRG08_055401 [Elysia crispata]